MSLARAFTRRLGRGGERAQADKDAKSRPQISLPMQLTEATNMLAFDAPNIGDLQFLHNVHFPTDTGVDSAMSTPYSEAASSGRTSDDKARSARSDSSVVTPTNENAPALTDSSSVESSPTAAKKLRDDYFPASGAPQLKRSHTDSAFPTTAVPQAQAPSLPRRAPSHSKREHERVARSRSLNRASGQGYTPPAGRDAQDEAGHEASNDSPSTERSTSPTPESDWRTSFDILGRSGSLMNRPHRDHSADAESGRTPPTRSLSASRAERRPNHPFSQELEQLNEVAEDVTGLDDVLEQFHDEEIMTKRGLVKHTADAYLADISPLKGVCFATGDTRVAHVDANGMQGWI